MRLGFAYALFSTSMFSHITAALEIITLTQEDPHELFCEIGISKEGFYVSSNKYVRCKYPTERFCTKIRFEDTDPERRQIKYVAACAHHQTCSRSGCAVSRTPEINTVTIATCCCNTTRCNHFIDVDDVLRKQRTLWAMEEYGRSDGETASKGSLMTPTPAPTQGPDFTTTALPGPRLQHRYTTPHNTEPPSPTPTTNSETSSSTHPTFPPLPPKISSEEAVEIVVKSSTRASSMGNSICRQPFLLSFCIVVVIFRQR